MPTNNTFTDKVYQQTLDNIADFAFDDNVASVFPDMIQRSVPGYTTIVAMTGVLAGRYAQANSKCYDLGCSLGASTLSMAQQIQQANCKIVAIDNSPAMIERCEKVISLNKSSNSRNSNKAICPIELQLSNIEDTVIKNASVVVLNFSLQFIGLEKRQAILQNIYDNMLEGGILILSEKILFADKHLQQLNTELHHEFKKNNGYSDLEISQKRSALENVLKAETIEAHEARLKHIGFSNCDVWFQCFNFASLVAIK